MKKHYRAEHNCLNCGNTFEGKFCNGCGQENLELHEDFGHVMAHAVGDYFHFDEKFFHTLRPLLFSPGKLTVDYMAGKRTQYLHPIRMYIFISLVYFILFFSETNRRNDTQQQQYHTEHQLSKAKTGDDVKASPIGSFTFNHKGDTTYAQYLQHQQKLTPAKRDGAFDSYLTKKFYEWQAKGETPNEALHETIAHNFPKTMFFLLPLFAWFLSITFRKNHKYYVEHLIYSFHLHCFIFLFASVIILLQLALPLSFSKTLQDISLLVVLYYVYRSLRLIYQRSVWRTITKMIGVGLMYFAGFIVAMMAVLAIAVALN